MDHYDQALADLLHKDALWASLPRHRGTCLVQAYRKPGPLFGGRAGTFLDAKDTGFERLYYPLVSLPVNDWMDIELLWKPWTLAVRPAGIGTPACVKTDKGAILSVYVWGPTVDAACRFWDELNAQLDRRRRLR